MKRPFPSLLLIILGSSFVAFAGPVGCETTGERSDAAEVDSASVQEKLRRQKRHERHDPPGPPSWDRAPSSIGH